MNLYGLIGFPLTHSFSKKYFTEKFEKENIKNSKYELFEIKEAGEILDVIKKNPDLHGLNVTIPHKEKIMDYLSKIDLSAAEIGAVNVIKIQDSELIGYNSDYYGFLEAFNKFKGPNDNFINEIAYNNYKALVLGDGGAAKAVKAVLKKEYIDYKIVSRKKKNDNLSYSDITKDLLKEYNIVINTTPLGMYPNINSCPDIPYQYLSDKNYLFDLVYNPLITKFMHKGKENGAHIKNGLEMLHLQAEKAWEIWNS